MEYDSAGQLINAALAPIGGAATNVWSYTYDAAGNRTGAENEINGANVTGTSSGYNDVNELQSQGGAGPLPVFFQGKIDRPGTVGINGQEATMTQDTTSLSNGKIFTETLNLPVGNNTVTITATNLNGTDIGTSNYSLTVAGGQNITFAYDLAGNLTNATTATTTNQYDWDAENRLVEFTQWTNGMKLSSLFSYDGFGRRVKIVEEQSGSTKQFVWSGSRLCQERDANNSVTRQFFINGEQIGGVNYYFTKDHLGSIREVTDNSGNIVARYDYDPYGVRKLLQGSDISDFGYTGYYVHHTSGLQFALYRAYDADFGRFINRDPIGERGGINLYDYVQNDPINDVDPNGKVALWVALLGITAIAAGIAWASYEWHKAGEKSDQDAKNSQNSADAWGDPNLFNDYPNGPTNTPTSCTLDAAPSAVKAGLDTPFTSGNPPIDMATPETQAPEDVENMLTAGKAAVDLSGTASSAVGSDNNNNQPTNNP